jgi:hypothetical protein
MGKGTYVGPPPERLHGLPAESVRGAATSLQLPQLLLLVLLGIAVSDLLVGDAEALHDALAKPGGEVRVTLSRETAEMVSQLLDARARGEEIVVTAGTAEVTPTRRRCCGVRRVPGSQAVLDLRDDRIAEITSFLDPDLFRLFGLPTTMP